MPFRRSAILRLLWLLLAVFRHVAALFAAKALGLLGVAKGLRQRREILGDLSGAARVRLFLQEASGILIKLGQIMAMRVDVLPHAVVDELQRLLDQVPSFPYEQAKKIVESSLGDRIENLFESFEKQPLASASFSQVHAATLHDGTQIVVKVQRPGVAELIAADIKLFRFFAFLLDLSTFTGRTPLKAVFTEFKTWTLEELDFRIEGAHVQEISEKAKEGHTEKIPRIYWTLTSKKVLTMERLRGLWVKEVMQGLQRDRSATLKKLKEFDTDLLRISETVLRNTLRQIFQYGVYHADPHAGNLLIMKGGVIGYVDFGITGRIGGKSKRQQVDLHVALESGDFERFFDAILRTIDPPYYADVSGFEAEVRRSYLTWLRAQAMGRANLGERSFARLMLAINEAARKNGVAFSSQEIRIFRTLSIADTVILDFSPSLDVRAIFRDFFGHYRIRKLIHEDIPNLMQSVPDLIGRMSTHIEQEVVQTMTRISRIRRAMAAGLKLAAVLVPGWWLFSWWLPELRSEVYGLEQVAALPFSIVLGLTIVLMWAARHVGIHSILRDKVVLPSCAEKWEGERRSGLVG